MGQCKPPAAAPFAYILTMTRQDRDQRGRIRLSTLSHGAG